MIASKQILGFSCFYVAKAARMRIFEENPSAAGFAI